MSRPLFIDADSLAYANSCICETKAYVVAKQDGKARGPYINRADALEGFTEGEELFTATRLIPASVGIANLESKLSRIIQEARERFGDVTPHVLLTGSANFRDRLPSRVTYKNNRLLTQKPAYLYKLRDHLRNEFGAKVIHWHEADDEVAMLMTEHPDGIAASIDKDLRQIPGDHMIPDKGFIKISPKSGLCRLYTQIIAGDTTDGVPGCYRVGPDGAQALVLKTAREVNSDDLKELEVALWKLALNTYADSLHKHGTKCGYTDPLAAAMETARFVYLLRKRSKDPSKPALWNPPS